MVKSTDAQLEKLKKQHEALMARIQACEARKRTIDRKEETRRKILAGAYYLDLARKEGRFEEIQTLMNNYLTRPADRKLFGLDEIPSEKVVEKERIAA